MENSPSTVHTESTATKSNSISAIVGNTIRVWSSESSLMEVDAVSEAELKENGFRSTRRTKIVCTIGPASCQSEQLESLAVNGMNVSRINMCHGAREWDRSVIKNARKLNDEKGYTVTIMMDTEGREIHMDDLGGASSVKDEVLIRSLYSVFQMCFFLVIRGCKIVGPTLGFLAFMVSALVECLVGALVWIFHHAKGRRIMGHPVTDVFPSVSNAIPL